MTEAEWLVCEEPEDLRVALVQLGSVSERRLRLVSCACSRRFWKLITDKRGQQAVDGTERYVEGQISAAELESLSLAARKSWEEVHNDFFRKSEGPLSAAAMAVYTSSPHFDMNVLSNAMGAAVEAFPKRARKKVEKRSQALLLRDIFGNPFRSVIFSPKWRTDTAVALAQHMYDSRDFGAMPILADALQDAGCDSENVLNHCRGPGPHVRGCWVVDAVLGKM